jgi:hypothetical protein
MLQPLPVQITVNSATLLEKNHKLKSGARKETSGELSFPAPRTDS